MFRRFATMVLVLGLTSCNDPDPGATDAGSTSMDGGAADAAATDAGPGDAGPAFACMLYDPPDCPVRDDATCTCSGCTMDGHCTIEDDCTCPECDDAAFLCLDFSGSRGRERQGRRPGSSEASSLARQSRRMPLHVLVARST